jgi:tripartite-type tricarboxylate transporter receptor subunit TctC
MSKSPLRRPRLLPLAAAGVCGLVLSGCGGDEAETEAATGGGGGAAAGEAAAFECGAGTSELEGETVRLVVGTDPGGGYDAYARLIAPYLGEELGADVVVENQPGAGGLLAVNSMIAGEADGTHLMIMNAPGNLSSMIAGVEGANFSLDDFSWIGRVASEPEIVTSSATGPYETWDDVLAEDEQLQIGTTGLGSAAYINGAAVAELFDLDAQLVTGYDSGSEAELGLAANDIDLLPGNLDSRLQAIEAGDARAVLALADEPLEDLPDVPTIGDYDLSPEKQELWEAHSDLSSFGRPLIGPAGIPQETVADLRGAMRCAFENPELIAESEEIGRPLSYLPGEEVEATARELADPPESYEEFLRNAYTGGN